MKREPFLYYQRWWWAWYPVRLINGQVVMFTWVLWWRVPHMNGLEFNCRYGLGQEIDDG